MNSETFKFECPACGQRISASIRHIGTTASCPSCTRPLVVPKALTAIKAPPATVRLLDSPAPTPVVSSFTPDVQTRRRIASRLVELESRQVGLVKIRPNRGMVVPAAVFLQNMGYKKRLLQDPAQFIVDCALSYHEAMFELLPITLLSGPIDGGRIHCWYGSGQYAGWQGYTQLTDNSYLTQQKICLVIGIHGFYDSLRDVIEPLPYIS